MQEIKRHLIMMQVALWVGIALLVTVVAAVLLLPDVPWSILFGLLSVCVVLFVLWLSARRAIKGLESRVTELESQLPARDGEAGPS